MSEQSQFDTIATIWWCGDEWCDCTQPQIVVRGPNRLSNVKSWRSVLIWEGTFYSEASPEEYQYQLSELALEAGRRDIPMESETSGKRPPTEVELTLFDIDEKEHRQYLVARGINP